MDSVSQTKSENVKTDSDMVWLLNIQRKLFQWSKTHPNESYGDLWNWIIDPRNLSLAFRRVSSNSGRNTSGVDGITVRKITNGIGEAARINAGEITASTFWRFLEALYQ